MWSYPQIQKKNDKVFHSRYLLNLYNFLRNFREIKNIITGKLISNTLWEVKKTTGTSFLRSDTIMDIHFTLLFNIVLDISASDFTKMKEILGEKK